MAGEDFHYNQRELAKLYIAKKGPGGLNYRVDKGKRKGEVIVNMPFLTKLFHDSIDYDRIIEIDKQELVLQPDYNPFLIYRLFTGGAEPYLTIEALSRLLETHFGIAHSFLDVSVMLQRQLPTYQPEQQVGGAYLTYTDFLALVMPKNADFAAFMRKRLREVDNTASTGSLNNGDALLNRGISEETHLKLRKLFLDSLILENELERQRRSCEVRGEVEDAHLVVFNTLIDRERKGHATVDDYLEYFKACYSGGLPFTHDDICYLFKRHDRFKQGKVVSSDFLREIAPL